MFVLSEKKKKINTIYIFWINFFFKFPFSLTVLSESSVIAILFILDESESADSHGGEIIVDDESVLPLLSNCICCGFRDANGDDDDAAASASAAAADNVNEDDDDYQCERKN